ncbi:MAG TPA: pyruvate kinase alpha/beta domain-containing protein [Methanocella sp.]|uniref:pyruvate kinase alpha/beta domain-containing protein n=1 Tax=Methanocella sp. TaxID=2052833 RepID=UPI002BD4A238|nr:pyruvate kinase alpha/beta domain-containing protein [Methanocella sp.]HTY92020.1 pyruvate kinase alpha/beta domain-containing protein [Methanocella sp.]
MITREIAYFEKPGPQNTDDTIRFAVKRAKELEIKYVVVASVSGETGVKAARAFKGTGVKVVVVGHHVGFSKPGARELQEPYIKELQALGAVIVEQTHALSGVERSISRRLGGVSRVEAIAEALRTLVSVGAKVAVECSIMAADGGQVPVDGSTEIIAMGGTYPGADTACVILPAHANNFFDMQIREFIAIPRKKTKE